MCGLCCPGHHDLLPRSLNVKLKVNKNNFDLLTDNVTCQPNTNHLNAPDFKIKINVKNLNYILPYMFLVVVCYSSLFIKFLKV